MASTTTPSPQLRIEQADTMAPSSSLVSRIATNPVLEAKLLAQIVCSEELDEQLCRLSDNTIDAYFIHVASNFLTRFADHLTLELSDSSEVSGLIVRSQASLTTLLAYVYEFSNGNREGDAASRRTIVGLGLEELLVLQETKADEGGKSIMKALWKGKETADNEKNEQAIEKLVKNVTGSSAFATLCIDLFQFSSGPPRVVSFPPTPQESETGSPSQKRPNGSKADKRKSEDPTEPTDGGSKTPNRSKADKSKSEDPTEPNDGGSKTPNGSKADKSKAEDPTEPNNDRSKTPTPKVAPEAVENKKDEAEVPAADPSTTVPDIITSDEIRRDSGVELPKSASISIDEQPVRKPLSYAAVASKASPTGMRAVAVDAAGKGPKAPSSSSHSPSASPATKSSSVVPVLMEKPSEFPPNAANDSEEASEANEIDEASLNGEAGGKREEDRAEEEPQFKVEEAHGASNLPEAIDLIPKAGGTFECSGTHEASSDLHEASSTLEGTVTHGGSDLNEDEEEPGDPEDPEDSECPEDSSLDGADELSLSDFPAYEEPPTEDLFFGEYDIAVPTGPSDAAGNAQVPDSASRAPASAKPGREATQLQEAAGSSAESCQIQSETEVRGPPAPTEQCSSVSAGREGQPAKPSTKGPLGETDLATRADPSPSPSQDATTDAPPKPKQGHARRPKNKKAARRAAAEAAAAAAAAASAEAGLDASPEPSPKSSPKAGTKAGTKAGSNSAHTSSTPNSAPTSKSVKKGKNKRNKTDKVEVKGGLDLRGIGIRGLGIGRLGVSKIGLGISRLILGLSRLGLRYWLFMGIAVFGFAAVVCFAKYFSGWMETRGMKM